ncbi:MFS transporter [Methylocapsa sp. S129]|uniref:MFS transporter n=1 Tax=Methylocapsa sp. S129 TaxID=1641869 RepID=UPI00131E352A|nr:MFS transporter [Methylocapsa sp. S129]
MVESDGLPVPQRYWSALAVWIALTMAVLDGAIANVALPTIARELSAAPDQTVWVVNGFQLAVVVSLLPLAALGEMIGYRRVYLVGIVIFTVASLGCALADSLPILIAARVLQGLGASGIMSVNGALVRFTYPKRMLGRGVGLNALVVAGAAAFGPTVASGILSLGPWEWLFAVNLPIGILAFFVARASLPASPTSGKLDLASTLLNIATFGFGFTGVDALTRGGNPWIGGAELVLAALTGLTLLLRSRAQPNPLVPIDLLRNKVFSLTVVTSIASFAAQMIAFVSLPFYLQGVLHRSQVDTGLLMTPWPLATGVAAAVAGPLADRFPAPILSGAGLALLALGLMSLALLPVDATSLAIVWRMAICGFGFGFFQTPNNRTMLLAAPIARSGAAGGMLATARLIGQTTGATLAAISFRFASNAEPLALGVAALFAAGAGAASLWRLRYASSPPPREPQPVADTL